MEKFRAFLKRKNIVFSGKRYGIDALGAMAQGLFCSLLIGTIIKTLGTQLGMPFLVDIGTYAMAVSGPAMAVAIGYALQAPPMVLFSLAAVGWASNAEGGAGGPLAVLIIAIIAAEFGKAVSKETKVDLLVTPAVTIIIGVALAKLIAPPIGTAASAFGIIIDNATKLQPFWMGIAVSVLVGIALTLPISSAAICSVLQLTGLAGGAAVAGCCGHEFPREPLGRPCIAGDRHLHAPDAQYHPQPQGLDRAHRLLGDHRTDCDLSVPSGNERRAYQLRHGDLRPLRSDRRLDRLGLAERGGNRQGRGCDLAHGLRLAGTRADQLYPAGAPLPADQRPVPQARLGQRRRPQAELKTL